MRSAQPIVILLALLSLSLQVIASPMGLSCEHETQDATVSMAADSPHAHHMMDTDPDSDPAPDHNCDCGCNCVASCAQASQINLLTANTASLTHINTELPAGLNGTPHLAYSDPLLRPPAPI